MAKLEDLKVGMRVAVYDGHNRFVGTPFIERPDSVSLLDCDDDRARGKRFHPKQIRILKPKRKAREWCIVLKPGAIAIYLPKELMPVQKELTVLVREVLPKKAGTKK